jgi:hypothetical protein
MDLFVISSAINTCSAPLSYYPIRSIYSKEERYFQTLQSIESVKRIPNKKVFFVECTDISEYEEDIKSRVDFYKNVYKGNESIIDGPNKGVGESVSILAADTDKYDNIYKLSGRYYLTDEFNYSDWDNEDTVMCLFMETEWRLTAFYKINKKQRAQWLAIMLSMVRDNEPKAIEQMMMAITDFRQIDRVGVAGLTHGGTFVEF